MSNTIPYAQAVANRSTTPVIIRAVANQGLSVTATIPSPTDLAGVVVRIAFGQGWSQRGDESLARVGLFDVEPTPENLRIIRDGLHAAGFNDVTVDLPGAEVAN